MEAAAGLFLHPDGGWRYLQGSQPSDNSNTGYAVLGLRYAEAPVYGFNCAIPASIKVGLNNWIATIQDPVTGDTNDGGSWYDPTWSCWNDLNSDPGWRNNYQAMYCLMKGLGSMGINTLTVGGNPVDWFAEFASAILASQQVDGFWPGDTWGDSILTTEWALLVLEKVAPPPPVDVQVKVPECACDGTGYDVTITYTVERFVVDGTLKIYEDGVLIDTVTLTGFTGVETYTRHVSPDTPGTHIWKAELDVTPVGGGTPGHAESEASVKVCETPKVAGIPDQTAPFQPFDLDTYLTYSGGLVVTWSASGVPADWTVTIDANNVVAVAAPAGASIPVDLTFTASITCGPGVVCSGSDVARFTPNRPPDCSKAAPSVSMLWPPNHKFVPVNVLGVTDPDGDPVTIKIDKIYQDEPVNTTGDGNFTPDGKGLGTPTAEVRAERVGTPKVPGNGRFYHIYFTATDPYNAFCSGEVLVAVPHDQKKPPVDGGPLYDSTVP